MPHAIRRVVAFELLVGYTIRVAFDDGVSRDVDLSDVLRGEMYGPLRNLALFRQVALDAEAHTLVWPNGADFDPATLYDWPTVHESFIALAKRWTPAAITKAG